MEYKRNNISLRFDNDTYYYTDYYYTYGLDVNLILPVFSDVSWKGVFLKAPKSTNEVSALSLSQRLYTPKNIRDTLIQFNDRPFSATLEMDQVYLSVNDKNGISFLTTIRIGVMGPMAGGKELQKLVHDWIDSPDPEGWDYQISNGLILNYDFLVTYPLYYTPSVSFSTIGSLRLGTLYDDIGAGIGIRWGDPKITNKKKFKVFLESELLVRFIAYNALLQGGLFSANNPYILSYHDLMPIVFNNRLSFGFSWYGVTLCAANNFLSKEFDAGSIHNYASISLAVDF